ncbi:MAG TPA: hypothetical protein VJX67_22830 [Blastocatellia bacterium]|nr:hypothetical protein [Blastocatellia bacterium]
MAETDWAGLLNDEDVEALWNGLYRLVSRHPSVRPLRFATDETAVSSELEINADLTQELFLELFQKQRFDYYVNNNYSSVAIEKELTRIELPNLVGGRLRKRYPESFRMARRVSDLLKTSRMFRLISTTGPARTAGRNRIGSSVTPDHGKVHATARIGKLSTRRGRKANGSRVDGAADRQSPLAVEQSSLIADANQGRAGRDVGPDRAPWEIDGTKRTPDPGELPDAASTQELGALGLLIEKQVAGIEPHDELEGEGAPAANQPRPRRMVDQVYGLRQWPRNKTIGDSGSFPDKAKVVAARKRDTRIVGRSGTSQLIVSNEELEDLIVEIFVAIDSPADVRTIRQLALSKVSLQDYNICSLDADFGSEETRNGGRERAAGYRRVAADVRHTPEEELIHREHGRQVRDMAGTFLSQLRRAVNNNPRRYDRLVSTLWHCYFDPLEPSQMEMAGILGVSDSLVSDNRRLIEHELKKLGLSVEDGIIFSESLKQLISGLTPRASSPNAPTQVAQSCALRPGAVSEAPSAAAKPR